MTGIAFIREHFILQCGYEVTLVRERFTSQCEYGVAFGRKYFIPQFETSLREFDLVESQYGYQTPDDHEKKDREKRDRV